LTVDFRRQRFGPTGNDETRKHILGVLVPQEFRRTRTAQAHHCINNTHSDGTIKMFFAENFTDSQDFHVGDRKWNARVTDTGATEVKILGRATDSQTNKTINLKQSV